MNFCQTISEAPVKHKVEYLGVIIEKDQKFDLSENFDPLIDLVEQRFDLRLTGRPLVANIEGFSRQQWLLMF